MTVDMNYQMFRVFFFIERKISATVTRLLFTFCVVSNDSLLETNSEPQKFYIETAYDFIKNVSFSECVYESILIVIN